MNLKNVILGTAFVVTSAGIMVNQSLGDGEKPWLFGYSAVPRFGDDLGLSYLPNLKVALLRNRVRDLDFSNCSICGRQMKDLFDLLEENVTALISFNKCEITVSGAEYLAEYLKKNNSLICLNLTSSDLSSKALRIIFEALKTNKRLTDFSLHSMNIGCNRPLAKVAQS